MRKWPYLILFAVLIAGVAASSIHNIPRITPAEAGPPMMQVICSGSTVAAGGGYNCSEGISDSNNLADDDSGTAIDGNGANGGSFTVSESGKLYSITVEPDGGGCTSVTVSLRWGTSTDLSSVYNEQVDAVNPGSGAYEFVMTDEDDISTGTTYYWAIEYSSGNTGCYIRYDNSGGSGTFYKGSSQWDLGSSPVANSAPTAEIKLCESL
jgi:hypothetical protein